MIIFKAKAREGYVFKILAELLASNIPTACFDIDDEGIRLRMMDTRRTILIDIDLDADSFVVYRYRKKERMSIGINMTHFHKMLKSIKKKDSIQLYIDDENPTELGIKVLPTENNRVTTSSIKIQNVQNIDTDLPEGYGKPINVLSTDFQKMCKDLNLMSTETRINSRGFIIRFSSDAGGVMKRSTEFGEREDSDSDDEIDDNGEDEYDEVFETEKLTRVTKISGLSTNLQIYPKEDKPLLLRSHVGVLGNISIYIKSKRLQDEDNLKEESDDDHEQDYDYKPIKARK